MPQPRHLKSPPITEAIIDFRVKARSGFQVRDFYNLKPSLAERFPKVEEAHGFEVKVASTPADIGPPLGGSNLSGYFFRSSDDKLIAQFRIDGFTLNRLKPYTRWEALFPMAMELWQRYREIASPETLVRLSLRYLNHISLPSLADLGRYLRSAPSIPPELPQHLTGSLSRVTIVDPDRIFAAHILQVVKADENTGRATFDLDIDVFRPTSVSPVSATDPMIMATLSKLRDFKNLIFFSYVSEEMLDGLS